MQDIQIKGCTSHLLCNFNKISKSAFDSAHFIPFCISFRFDIFAYDKIFVSNISLSLSPK